MRAAIRTLRSGGVPFRLLGHPVQFLSDTRPRPEELARIGVILIASDDAERVVGSLRHSGVTIPIVTWVFDLHPDLWPHLVKKGVTAIVPPNGRVCDYLFAAESYHKKHQEMSTPSLPEMHQRTHQLLELLLEHRGNAVSLDRIKSELAIWSPPTLRKYISELETVCEQMGWSLMSIRANRRHEQPRRLRLRTN